MDKQFAVSMVTVLPLFISISISFGVFLYHQQESVAAAVGVLDVLLSHLASLVLLLLASLFLGLLLLLLLPLEVLGCLQADQRPPALHLLSTKDGESRTCPILRHLNRALTG